MFIYPKKKNPQICKFISSIEEKCKLSRFKKTSLTIPCRIAYFLMHSNTNSYASLTNPSPQRRLFPAPLPRLPSVGQFFPDSPSSRTTVRNSSPDLLRRQLWRWLGQIPLGRCQGLGEPKVQDGRVEDLRKLVLVERQWQVYTSRFVLFLSWLFGCWEN